jgi:hypothetical protein
MILKLHPAAPEINRVRPHFHFHRSSGGGAGVSELFAGAGGCGAYHGKKTIDWLSQER